MNGINIIVHHWRMLKLNSRWIKELNVKELNNKLFEEKQGNFLYNPVLGELVKHQKLENHEEKDKYLTV